MSTRSSWCSGCGAKFDPTGPAHMCPVVTTISAYGVAPSFESPRNPLVPPFVPQVERSGDIPLAYQVLAPCPKCKRHCRAGECPFCYADALKPEAMAKRIADLEDERDTAIRERDVAVRQLDGLCRDLAKLLADHGGAP